MYLLKHCPAAVLLIEIQIICDASSAAHYRRRRFCVEQLSAIQAGLRVAVAMQAGCALPEASNFAFLSEGQRE